METNHSYSPYHPYQTTLHNDNELAGMLTPQSMEYWLIKYGYAQKLESTKGLIKLKVSELYKKTRDFYKDTPHIKVPFVHMEYMDLGNNAGACNPKLPVFVFNPLYMLYDPQYFVEVIVPHEYAHLVDYIDNPAKFKRTSQHDNRWQRITNMLVGANLEASHQLPPRDSIKVKLEENQTISTDDFIFIRGEQHDKI